MVHSRVHIYRISKRLYCNLKPNYVPEYSPVQNEDVLALKEFIHKANNIVILTGAGVSTESGIPDYRSEKVGLYARTNHKPIQYQAFVNNSDVRTRYWARNFIGWERFSKCTPNETHMIIKELELKHRKCTGVVTQNVDSLHSKAGSENVIELHGSAYKVVCLNCDKYSSRYDVQKQIIGLNPDLRESSGMVRPDGDVEISDEATKHFKPPFCESCGGTLKPDIVFFGDNVPKQRVENVRRLVSESDSLLALGTSLTVFSSYRIVLQALEEHKNIAIVNIGPTRADQHVSLKIGAKCGDILPKLFI